MELRELKVRYYELKVSQKRINIQEYNHIIYLGDYGPSSAVLSNVELIVLYEM